MGKVIPFGDTLIEERVIAFTVNVVFPLTPLRVAVIVELPAAIEVARPLEPLALLIVAVAVVPELQVTDEVMTDVVPSEYAPVATNCFV
jgi:hypothetical protein